MLNSWQIIKKEIYQIICLIKNNVFVFIHIIFLFLILEITNQSLIFLCIGLQQNLLILLVFSFLVFSLINGLFIGLQKNIFNAIDNKPVTFISIFNYFHILPKIILNKIITGVIYIPLIVTLSLLIAKLISPSEMLNFNNEIANSTNSQEMNVVLDHIQSIIYKNLTNLFIIDFIPLLLSLLMIIIYTIKFWMVSRLIIDQNFSLIFAYRKSATLNQNILQLIQIFIIICAPLTLILLLNINLLTFLYVFGGGVIWNLFWSNLYREKIKT